MANITLLPDDCRSRADFVSSIQLPPNYMADFSIMGLVLNDYRTACKILLKSNFTLKKLQKGAQLLLASPQQLQQVIALLREHDINAQITDLADTLYQA